MTLKLIDTKLIDTRPGVTLPPAAEVAGLMESMKTVGLLNPITVGPHNLLIAGRHRLAAARALGWAQIPVNMVMLVDMEAELATIDENLRRNVLTKLARSEHVARRVELLDALGQRAKRGGQPERPMMGHSPKTTAELGAEIGLSRTSLKRDMQIARDLAPDVKNKLRETPTEDNTTELLALAQLPITEQRRVAARVVERGETVKQAQRALKHAVQVDQVRAYVPPAGQFAVLVVDPPWRYSDELDGSDEARGGCPYPTMSIEQIAALDLPAADDCSLFLWTTNSHLVDPAAYAVVAATWSQRYGFRPVQIRTWCKPRMGLGRVWRNDTEHLVRFERGRPVFAAVTQTTSFEAPSPGHSVKPAQAYADIEALCPSTSRCELFARAERPGWVTAGAEIQKKRRKLQIVDVDIAATA